MIPRMILKISIAKSKPCLDFRHVTKPDESFVVYDNSNPAYDFSASMHEKIVNEAIDLLERRLETEREINKTNGIAEGIQEKVLNKNMKEKKDKVKRVLNNLSLALSDLGMPF